MRAFLAFSFSSSFLEAISMTQAALTNDAFNIAFVRPDQCHLTLKFFETLDEGVIDSMSKRIDVIVKKYYAFDIHPEKVGTFGRNNPNVLWIGIKEDANLNNLFYDLEECFSNEFHFPPETRSFKPHLTIGRIKHIDSFSIFKKALIKVENKVFEKFRVNEIILFKSELTPDGPIHTPIKRFALKD